MQVNLIKEADFDFKSEKYTNIPFDTFTNLVKSGVDVTGVTKKSSDLLQMQLFENIAEFNLKYEPGVYDEEKGVFVMPNGKILMFLKQSETVPTETSTDTQGSNKDNESTNPKENLTKKA